MFSATGTIFMLHRIFPYETGKVLYNENMKLSPQELDVIISSLKQSKNIFVSLDELTEIVKGGKQTKHKFIAFTLDDGYIDNLTHAYSIFKHHNIPFCIYVTNSFPNQTSDLWWYGLEQLILQNEALTFSNGQVLSNSSIVEKRKNFLTVRGSVLNEHFKNPIGYFKQLGELRFDISAERKSLCLTWEQIKQLSKDPLVTIGSHTINHLPLSKLNHKAAEDEIILSKVEIESKISKKVKHFAFPFGSTNEAGEREYNIVKTVGFDTVVTTLHGHVHVSDDLQKLDRIFLAPMKNDSRLIKRKAFWAIKSMVRTLKSYVTVV